MNYAKIRWFPILMLVALFAWGCDQSPLTTETPGQPDKTTSIAPSDVVHFDQLALSPKLSAQAKATNKQLEAISRAVAKVLADDEVRQYLHEQAMQKFDGETNVLWMQLNERSAGEDLPTAMQQAQDKPWTSLVKNNLPPSKTRGMAHKIGAIIDRASRLLGGPIHLYWADAEDFDGSRAPLVTFTPVGVDADYITDIEAFDAEGDVHIVNGQIAEQRPVVVLAANERVSKEDLRSGTLESISGDVAMSDAMLDDGGSGGGGGGGSTSDGDGYYDCGFTNGWSGDLRLDWVNFSSDSEGWAKGGSEFRAQINRYQVSGADSTNSHDSIYLPISDDDVEDGDEECIGDVLFDWQTDEYLSQHVKWYEEDGGEDQLFHLSGMFKTPYGDVTIDDFTITVYHEDDGLVDIMADVEDFTDNPDQDQEYGSGMPNFKLTLVE